MFDYSCFVSSFFLFFLLVICNLSIAMEYVNGIGNNYTNEKN